MFRQSKKDVQLDMFSNTNSLLNESIKAHYNDKSMWHNIFYEYVFKRINEDIFKDLFSDKMGAPNASIRLLIGMMAIKEGHGWSDSELFEQCEYHILVRAALGLHNLTDKLPAQSTYYLFRRRVHDYQKENDIDLMKTAFQSITAKQSEIFKVNGKSIRMDSKLIGSNIAWCTRYEIIHETIVVFYKSLSKRAKALINKEDQLLIESLQHEGAEKVVYRSNREDIQKQLQKLGILIYKLINVYKEEDSKQCLLLKQIFSEQYKVIEDEQIELRSKEEIQSGSIQSPYDTDCAYKNKDRQKVKGFSFNVTETCDDNHLNLITDIQVAPANTPDTEFVIEGIEGTKKVIGHIPENAHTDGAFHNPVNREYCKEKELNWYLNGIQGISGRYDLEMIGDILKVTDTKTGKIIPAEKAINDQWRIPISKGYRYFGENEIDVCNIRKAIIEMPAKLRNKRNNVEATIFQLCYFTRNNKTRYRGIAKQKTWASMRCLWINLVRIVKFVGEVCTKTGNTLENQAIIRSFTQKCIEVIEMRWIFKFATERAVLVNGQANFLSFENKYFL
jgi:hypothetical protein